VKVVRDHPCASCPYRADVRREHWDRQEFIDLLGHDQDPVGAVYGCHEGIKLAPVDRSLCIGWLIDQRERNVPSIRLRMLLMKNEDALALLEKANDGGFELYPSLQAMCRANGVQVNDPIPEDEVDPRTAPPKRSKRTLKEKR